MNNILHLKYAVEVDKTGSISKAAENLFMGQPHLSKAIKELEESLGIAIFNRTSKGVVPTKKGREFLIYAKNILSQIDEMNSLYKSSNIEKQRFDISVPRASYVSYAFIEFIKELDQNKEIDINYHETNSVRAIKNVADSINNLAIVRYQTMYEKYFLNAIEERNLVYKPIWEFEYLILMSKNHPLAVNDIVEFSQLVEYTEIIHGDISIPALPLAEARQMASLNGRKKHISVYERGSQFELLSGIPTTYMWVSPMPKDTLDRFGIVQKRCNMSKNKYKDILIYRRGYHLSDEDNLFIKILMDSVEIVSKI